MTAPNPIAPADDVLGSLPASRRRRRFSVDDLFTDSRPQAVGVDDLPTAKEIRLDRIVADPDQPRRTFDEAKLEELAASVRAEGVLQPIVVRYDAERDTYVVVHGERRWRAAAAAGLASIPTIVRDVPADRRLIHQLMENVVRDDLNALDRAAALRALKAQLGDAPWDTVAAAVGVRRSRLFQLLGTEKLPETVQADIRAGRLSEKQSRALQGLPEEHQRALRDAILADDLQAEVALAIARRLKAERVPDDLNAAAAAIARFRAESATAAPAPDASSGDELTAILGAIAAATRGGSAARASLKRVADSQRAPAYAGDRLHDELLALARTLARMPPAELAADAATRDRLATLARTLATLLGNA